VGAVPGSRAMNGRIVRVVSCAALLLGAGCASAPDRSDGEGLGAVREKCRELEARLDALDGGDLLRRFPPPEWSEERLSRIIEREITTHQYRTEEEAAFIDRFDEWKRAAERRRVAEAGRGEPSPGDAPGHGGGK